MKTLLLIFFMILFLPACPFKYMGDPPEPIIIEENSNCSSYGCGGGVCEGEGSEDAPKTCVCYENHKLYHNQFNTKINYCIAKPKQFIADSHKIVISNYGSDVPIDVDPINEFLYYYDSDKVYTEFYLLDNLKSIKLFDNSNNYEVVKEIKFNKEIKEIVFNEDKRVILFENGNVEVYSRTFSNKLIKFSNGDDKIIKISSNSFLSLDSKFISYEIKEPVTSSENWEWSLSTQYIEELSPSLDLINNNCSLMDVNVIKCIENNEIVSRYEFIKNDEQILWVKDNCTYTDKNNLYCEYNGKQRVKEDIYIKTTNKNQFGSNGYEFCYLDNFSLHCIQYYEMDIVKN